MAIMTKEKIEILNRCDELFKECLRCNTEVTKLERKEGSKDEIRKNHQKSKECADEARELLVDYKKLLDEEDEGK
jgi:hypothetical protein